MDFEQRAGDVADGAVGVVSFEDDPHDVTDGPFDQRDERGRGLRRDGLAERGDDRLRVDRPAVALARAEEPPGTQAAIDLGLQLAEVLSVTRGSQPHGTRDIVMPFGRRRDDPAEVLGRQPRNRAIEIGRARRSVVPCGHRGRRSRIAQKVATPRS